MVQVLLAAVGFVAGALGGLLGIGGSVIMIPCMRELLADDQHLYQAAAMIVNFFVAVPSVVQHLRARAVIPAVVVRMAPTAAIAVLAGVMLSELSFFRDGGEVYLAGVFGLFLFYVAFVNVQRLVSTPRNPAQDEKWDSTRPIGSGSLGVGVAVGIIGGLLGVGGGIVAVPLQQRFLRVPLRSAIANSAATIILLSAIGAALKNYQLVAAHHYPWHRSLALAAVLIPTGALGGFVGARLTHVLPIRVIRGAFAALMVIAGLRMTLRALTAF